MTGRSDEETTETAGRAFPAGVAAVLAGECSYDALDSEAQAIVRAEWSRRIAVAIENLDFAAEFEARCETYSELLHDVIVTHNP